MTFEEEDSFAKLRNSDTSNTINLPWLSYKLFWQQYSDQQSRRGRRVLLSFEDGEITDRQILSATLEDTGTVPKNL